MIIESLQSDIVFGASQEIVKLYIIDNHNLIIYVGAQGPRLLKRTPLQYV